MNCPFSHLFAMRSMVASAEPKLSFAEALGRLEPVELFLVFLLLLLLMLSMCVLFSAYIRSAKAVKDALEQNNKLLTIDETTGLLNERSFELAVKTCLEQAHDATWFVLDFDINHFEHINALHGFQHGNEILQEIATHLLAMRQSDAECFARIYADHFVCLITANSLADGKTRVEALDQTLHELNSHSGLNCSYGFYEITDRTLPVSVICDYALAAKRLVKGNFIHSIGVYDAALHQKQIQRSERTAAMEPALQNHEFIPYYQPKYDIQTETIVGAEALVRWNRPGQGLLMPGSFISIFEENGLITKLDMYMLETVCKTMRQRLDDNLPVVPISVNFSRNHLYDASFMDKLLAVLHSYNIPMHLIEVELTESAFIDCKETLLHLIRTLHEMGLQVSIDDFGSGYSSLNMLKDMAFDIVKLDREFLATTTLSDNGRIIVQSILTLARKLHFVTIAEGVETAEQLAFLRESGCDIAQGYHFAKPMPEDAFFAQLDQMSNQEKKKQ